MASEIYIYLSKLLKYAYKFEDIESIKRLMSVKTDLFNLLIKIAIEQGLLNVSKNKLTITDKGGEFIGNIKSHICTVCTGTGIDTENLKDIEYIKNLRIEPDINIDQCPVKLDDLARRVNFILDRDEIKEKDILCIGDNDLTSLALSTISKPNIIKVVDMDLRVLENVKSINKENCCTINTLHFDIKNIVHYVPEELKEKFDIFITDPPYTEVGMKFFIALGLLSLKRRGVGYIVLPFLPIESWSNELLFKIESLIINSGFMITDNLRNFQIFEHEAEIISSILRIERVVYMNTLANTLMEELKNLDINKFYTFR